MNEQNRKKASTIPQGRESEEQACQYLRKKGFVILHQNLRFKMGEIDIVANEGNVLVFVEVRSRSSLQFGAPKATVGPKKQWHIIKAAQCYLLRVGGKPPFCRFDVVSVVGYGENSEIEHIRNAFQMPIEVRSHRGKGPWQAY